MPFWGGSHTALENRVEDMKQDVARLCTKVHAEMTPRNETLPEPRADAKITMRHNIPRGMQTAPAHNSLACEYASRFTP